MKLDSIKIVENGLLALEETCLKCTPSVVCQQCKMASPTVRVQAECDEGEDDGERVYDENDGDATDDEESDSDDEVSDVNYAYGFSVWAKYLRTWYPAKVVSTDVLPPALKRKFENSEGLVPVQWYGEDRYSLVQERHIDTLAQNRVDETRAGLSEQMLIKYNMALSDLHND